MSANMSGITTLSPGVIFAGDYRVVRELRRGGMGSVYVAEQLSTGAERALKLMHAKLIAHDQLFDLFEQEARIGAQIKSDHVVQVIDAGVDEASGVPWLSMELLEGECLHEKRERLGLLHHSMVVEIMNQVCYALAAAHKVGVVHRDIKPENIFIAQPQQEGNRLMVKILDFGIAKLLAEATAQGTPPMSTRIGTPYWMAPEQAFGTGISTSADVWAIGLLAFWLLTGRSYWTSEPSEIEPEMLYWPLVSASARAAEYGCAERIPVGFDAWFARCVARNSKDRFANAGLARETLNSALYKKISLPPGETAPASSACPPELTLDPQPPGAAYDPLWYIPREREEREALNYLGFPGKPAVLFGPDRSGKTWLLGHCLAQLEKRGAQKPIVVDFKLLDRGSLDRLLQGLATRILQQLDLPAQSIFPVWQGPGTAMTKMTRLMEQRVLPEVKSALVLALDDVDKVSGTPFRDDVFSLLRAWAESYDRQWSKLRLVLAVSTTPAQLINDPNSSPFNLAAPIVLDDLSTEQVEELGRRYRLAWSRHDIEQVMALVGGNPYLIRLLMHQAALQATPLRKMLDPVLGVPWILAYDVQRIRAGLKKHGLLELTARLAGNPACEFTSEEVLRLLRSGVAVEEAPGVLRLRDGLHAIAARAPV
jgi:serine/threonine protein kinase